ncbi:unnamed protein product [Heterobilharzia americana]|nr:unnamed protein product [Heterobilharzia americana]
MDSVIKPSYIEVVSLGNSIFSSLETAEAVNLRTISSTRHIFHCKEQFSWSSTTILMYIPCLATEIFEFGATTYSGIATTVLSSSIVISLTEKSETL